MYFNMLGNVSSIYMPPMFGGGAFIMPMPAGSASIFQAPILSLFNSSVQTTQQAPILACLAPMPQQTTQRMPILDLWFGGNNAMNYDSNNSTSTNPFQSSIVQRSEIVPNAAEEFKQKTKKYEPLHNEVSRTIVSNTDLSKYGKQNAEKIKYLQPQMQTKAIRLLEFAKSKGLNVIITSGFRTQEQQQHLLKTRPKYAAKNSLHCLGRAIDITITNGKDSDYVMLGQYAKSIGMRWGGDFSKVRERWHFDIGRV